MNNPHLMPHSGFRVFEKRRTLLKNQVVVVGNKIYVENLYHFIFSCNLKTDFNVLLNFCVEHANEYLKKESEEYAAACMMMIRKNSNSRMLERVHRENFCGVPVFAEAVKKLRQVKKWQRALSDAKI